MAVLRINGEPAYDEVIGLGYDYSTVSFAPVRLKIGNTYIPFSNKPPTGWKYSTIQKIKLIKDGVEYKPIKKKQYIKFNIVLAPGPYNIPSETADYWAYLANNNGAYAYPKVTDTYIIDDADYHILLYGPAARRVSNAMQVTYCALGSVKVSTNEVRYESYNSIGNFNNYNDWYWRPDGSFLTNTAEVVWRLVVPNGKNLSTKISAASGKQMNSTGGSYRYIDIGKFPHHGSIIVVTKYNGLGSYFSYKDGWWGANSYGGAVSYFTYKDGLLVPVYDSSEGHGWKGNYNFSRTIPLAYYDFIETGSTKFTGLARQYCYSYSVNVGSQTTPNYQTFYSCAGVSSQEQTKEVTIWLEK